MAIEYSFALRQALGQSVQFPFREFDYNLPGDVGVDLNWTPVFEKEQQQACWP